MASISADPAKRQKLLLGVLVIGLLGYATYTYVYTPRAEAVSALEDRLETLQIQNQTARALAQGEGVEDVERQLALYRDQLVAVEGLIPLSEEVPDLLDAISAEAQRTGIELTLLQPTGAVEENFYTRRTYDLAVVGGFHEIGYFLGRIGSLPRIITPIGLSLTPRQATARDGSPRLDARFSIETYVLPPQGAASEGSNVE